MHSHRFAVTQVTLCLLLAGICANLPAGAAKCPVDPTGMGVLLPWYVGPWDPTAYNTLASYGPRCGIYAIVTGDAVGPPTHSFSLYRTAFATLTNAGIYLYGYVHTMADVAAHTARPLPDLISEVNAWYDNFGSYLLGIFFDEVDGATTNVNPLSFYGALSAAVYNRNASSRVVFNPGTKISCTLARLSDVYVRYESYASQWTSVDFPGGTRCDCPSDSSCAVLLHGQPAPTISSPENLLTTLVNQAASREFSYFFVTNRTMPNPWDGLPSYFDALMRVVAPRGTTQPPPPPPRRPPPPPPTPAPRPNPSPLSRPRPPSPVSKPPPSPRPPPPRPPPTRPSPAPPPPRPSPPSPSVSNSPPLNKSLWRPSGILSWQWQLSGDDFRPMLRTRPQVVDVDVDQVAALLAQATEVGVPRTSFKLICYFSVGTYEPGRVDADQLRGVSWTNLEKKLGGGNAAAGAAVPGPLYASYMDPPFSVERWFAIDRPATRSALLSDVMIPRMKSAVAAGCDAIEMDNVDTYDNVPGIPVTAQLSYNAALLDAAHGLGLSAGLKNALDLLKLKFADGRAVVDTYDWFLNERCWEFNECNMYGESIKWPAAVFGVEYCDARAQFGSGARNLRPECVCPLANGPAPGASAGTVTLNWLIKTVDLSAVGLDCRRYCSTTAMNCSAPAAGSVTACVKNTPTSLCSAYRI